MIKLRRLKCLHEYETSVISFLQVEHKKPLLMYSSLNYGGQPLSIMQHLDFISKTLFFTLRVIFSLFVEKLPNHPDYKNVPAKEKANCKKVFAEYIDYQHFVSFQFFVFSFHRGLIIIIRPSIRE